MINNLVCIDRDGVLIYDEKTEIPGLGIVGYHLGRQENWKALIKVLSNVIEGLKVLNTIPNLLLYMITNQPGVAVKEFSLLTLEKAHEVCQYIVDLLYDMGGRLDGYFICPHASLELVKERSNYTFIEEFVGDFKCIKPRLRMVFNALKLKGYTPDNTYVYMIGYRASHIQMGLNFKDGKGIFVPFQNSPGELEKVKKFKEQDRIYIAKDFLDAARFIRDEI